MSPRPVAAIPADGLLLRPWRDEDVAGVLTLARDPVTRQWSPSLRPIHDEGGALAWLARRRDSDDRVDWAVADAATDQLVGRCGLHRFDEDPGLPGVLGTAEIGYGVLPAYRGRGVARRAVLAATRHGFAALALARVTLLHATGNRASCAVAASCGFALEGVERGAIDHGDGVRHDAHRHARLVDDPPGRVGTGPAPLAPVELVADGLRLAPWQPGDTPELAAALGEPHIVRWNPTLPVDGAVDEATAARWIAARRAGWSRGASAAWAVRDATTDRLVGSMALRDLDRAQGWGYVSYWVRAADRGRGVAPRALEAVTGYGFTTLGVHRIALFHALGNGASCRVATKAGYRLEGTVRGSDVIRGERQDEHLHARLATDQPDAVTQVRDAAS